MSAYAYLAILLGLFVLGLFVVLPLALGIIRLIRRDPTDPVFGKGKERDK
jgi:hypothetical protein